MRTTTWAAGRGPATSRVASMPSRSGIERSISTTSGRVRARRASTASRRRRPCRRPRCRRRVDEQLREPGPHEAVVVGDEDADHAGTSTRTVVPSPGDARHLEPAAGVLHEVAQHAQPEVPVGAGRSPTQRGVEPAAVVGDLQHEPCRRRSRSATCAARRRGVLVRRCAAPPGRSGTGAARRPRSASASAGDVERRRQPARGVGARRGRASAAARPASVQARRIDVDEQRAQRADAVARLVAAPSRSAVAGRGSPLPLSRSRVGRQSVGDADEVLHDAVVQVGGDQPALGLRGVERAAQQRLALVLAAAQPARERARERQVDELQQQQAAEQRRARRPATAAGRWPTPS